MKDVKSFCGRFTDQISLLQDKKSFHSEMDFCFAVTVLNARLKYFYCSVHVLVACLVLSKALPIRSELL